MGIRLMITGGYGGPATWQNHLVETDLLNEPEWERIVDLIARFEVGSTQRFPSIPDGQTFEFQIELPERNLALSVPHAAMTGELYEVVQAIQKHSQRNPNAFEENQIEEEKEGGTQSGIAEETKGEEEHKNEEIRDNKKRDDPEQFL